MILFSPHSTSEKCCAFLLEEIMHKGFYALIVFSAGGIVMVVSAFGLVFTLMGESLY